MNLLQRLLWRALGLGDVSRHRRLLGYLHRLAPDFFAQPPASLVGDRTRTFVRRALIAFLDHWAPRIGGDVLDVGAGTWTYPRRRLAGRCRYLALDVCPDANVDVVADAQAMAEALGENRFDWVLCLDVIEHVERPADLVDQIFRVLRPGGRLLLTTPFNFHLHGHAGKPEYWRVTPDGLRLLCRRFRRVEVHEIGPRGFPYSLNLVAEKGGG